MVCVEGAPTKSQTLELQYLMLMVRFAINVRFINHLTNLLKIKTALVATTRLARSVKFFGFMALIKKLLTGFSLSRAANAEFVKKLMTNLREAGL
jgi:hypothetical protein